MYRVALESILGLQLLGDHFRVDPTIPNNWPKFALSYRHGKTTYAIAVENPDGVSRGIRRVELDGHELPSVEIPMLGDGRQHSVRVLLGPAPPETDQDGFQRKAGT
jgi:cyclic beta-1,2-glucan synthetase